MQLVVCTGYDYSYFTREQDFAKLRKIDPILDEIELTAVSAPTFLWIFFLNLDSSRTFEAVVPCAHYHLHWEALEKVMKNGLIAESLILSCPRDTPAENV